MPDGLKEPSTIDNLMQVLQDPRGRAGPVAASGAALGALATPLAMPLTGALGAGLGIMADEYHALRSTKGSGLEAFLATLKSTQNPGQMLHDMAKRSRERSHPELTKRTENARAKAQETDSRYTSGPVQVPANTGSKDKP